MKLIPTVFLITCFLFHGNVVKSAPDTLGTISNVFKSGKDITVGAASKIADAIPSGEDLFQLSKNALVGYPFEAVASAINKLCSVAISAKAVKPRISPNVKNMTFILVTPTRNYSFPLTDAEEMWKSPAFDKSKPTVILVTGWTTDVNETVGALYRISNAYLCRGNVNFAVVDTASFIDTLYTWSAFNTEEIGSYIGKALIHFAKYADTNSIHLIGHSLGAHIVGAAGRTFSEYSDVLLPRITGLDPAKPCFNEGESLTGLNRGDAQFIDIIHSNPGVLGKRDSLGDVDFYAGGLNPLPVGCVSITCAHARAWEYYAESVLPGNENNFMAVKCTSLSNVEDGKCPGKQIPMGYAVPHKARGNYFLQVNEESPFGKNATTKNMIQCHNQSKTKS